MRSRRSEWPTSRQRHIAFSHQPDAPARGTLLRFSEQMTRFGIRTVLLFTAVYAVYMLLLVSVRPIGGFRLLIVPRLSIFAESVVLLFVTGLAFMIARQAAKMELDHDWRRGLLQGLLGLAAIGLLAAPILMRGILLIGYWLSHMHRFACGLVTNAGYSAQRRQKLARVTSDCREALFRGY